LSLAGREKLGHDAIATVSLCASWYKLAPGVQLVGEYMYIQRHQGGFDFNQGAPGETRDAKGQGFMFATVLSW